MTSHVDEVPVSVVEDHDEALVVIYRAIGSKRLPLSGTSLVHFDAHPDLLSPNLPADEFTDKEKLFACTSIAEWILPAVYMNHISCVVWIKPPWSSQIRDGEYSLVVGRERDSGHIRVATPLAYFISDQLYTPIGGLTDTRSIPLHVVTLPVLEQALSQNSGQKLLPGQQSAGHVRYSVGQQLAGQQLAGQQSVGQCDVSDQDSVVTRERDIPLVLPLRKKSKMEPVIQPQLPSSSSSSSPSSPSSSSPNCSPKLTRAVGVVCEALGTPTGSWILDIDLDFFSTANPFNKEFSQEEYIFLEKLYRFQEPANNSKESLSECVDRRAEQLGSLLALWSEEGETKVGKWTREERERISTVKAKIGMTYDGVPFETEDVHLAGMMTDLPHHPANHSEMTGLMMATSHLLQTTVSTVGLPALVTIARSAEDGYTPAAHVEQLLEETVGVVKHLCGSHTAVYYNYLDPTH